jgi:hydroxypyruvate reductase
MKPHVLLIEPMMPEVETQLDAGYCVHRLFAAHDRAALIAAIGSSVRAIVTGGGHGASNEIVDALPRLEIIAINGIGTDAVDLERARARSVRVTTTKRTRDGPSGERRLMARGGCSGRAGSYSAPPR